MQVVVVGAGPVGLFCALALARRGHSVTVVDRDPVPPADGVWQRRGVMQFRHPHGFRPIVHQVLLESLPDVWETVITAGGIPVAAEGWPSHIFGLNCRRATFERATWSVAAVEQGLTLRRGFAQRVLAKADRVLGVNVDGGLIAADLVIVAAGRTSRLGDEFRAPGAGGPCGHAYITRMYRAREGVTPPFSTRPILDVYPGYLAAVFPQDDRTFSTLVHVPANDSDLTSLRHEPRWDAAVRRIPVLAQWTDPDRFEPITEVMRGGLLTNTYRGQYDLDGNVAVSGLLFIGDAVSTTNPHRGRGISLGLQQAAEFLRLFDQDSHDPRGLAREFENWCLENIWPWFEDQVHSDAALLARFRGEDVDLDSRLPSEVICDAIETDPSLLPVVGPYLVMRTQPASLRVIEARVRALLRDGWRAHFASGPSRDELVALMEYTEMTQSRRAEIAMHA